MGAVSPASDMMKKEWCYGGGSSSSRQNSREMRVGELESSALEPVSLFMYTMGKL